MSLHLTRAFVSYEIAAKWRKDGGFRDSYHWHKRAWDCFPGKPNADRDFLTRVDDTGNSLRLLILSPEIPVRPDWCPLHAWSTKTISESFLTHSEYRFSLLANPTKKLSAPRDKHGRRRGAKRVPLVHREDLLAWLTRKASQHGFSINPERIQTIPRPRQLFIKTGKAGLHSAVEFSGILTITDHTTFRLAFVNGIGSAKAFGFGMLCLAPI